jgi:hypothetical protein
MLPANTKTNYQQRQRPSNYLLTVLKKKNMPQGGFEPPLKTLKQNRGGICRRLPYMKPGISSKLERCKVGQTW